MARRSPARCRHCRLPIKWLVLRGSWTRFEPRPVDGLTHIGRRAYPVDGPRAWSFPLLVTELMGRRQIGRAEAEDEAYAMPWHVRHICPPPDHHHDREGAPGT